MDHRRKIITFVPTFYSTIDSAQKNGADVIKIQCDYNNGYVIDQKMQKIFIKTIQTEQPHLVWLSNPYNPTGAPITIEFIKKVCETSNGIVAIDEAGIEFIESDQYKSGVELTKKYKNLIVLRSFSKAFALAGLRFGYAVGNKKLIKILEDWRPIFHLSVVTQALVIEQLKDINHSKNIVKKTRIEMDRFLQHSQKWQNIRVVSASKSNSAMLESPVADLYQELLKHNIMTTQLYGYNGIGKRHLIRVAIKNTKLNKILLSALDKVDKELQISAKNALR